MKLLAENNGYELFYEPSKANRYMVYKKPENGFKTMVAQSPIFSKKIKSYFTKLQVSTVIAKVHALRYVSNRFKSS